MSHEASNWVLRQRSRSCATQCLLLVIANAADPDGVAFGWWKSRDHWWPYLVERTRLKRATLFKLLKELEELGYFSRGEIKPEGGGPAQPVIVLHLERDVIEPERPDETAGLESTRETEQAARPPPQTPLESTSETEKPAAESMPETDHAVSGPPRGPVESTRETARDVPVGNPFSPQSPPLRREAASHEVNGFAAFFSDYPDRQVFNRTAAQRAFNELTGPEQQQALKTVAFYARDIAKLKRRPVSPANWLKERRFTEYGSGKQTGASGGALVLVPEGSEPWQAWCAVAAVAFGGQLKIPPMWASSERPGAWRPSQWPPGAEAWRTPLDRWLFVEMGTAQHGRWAERVFELFGRMPVSVRLAATRPARVIEAKNQKPERVGLFVPAEWPPPKGGAAAKAADGASLASAAELDEFARTG